jgi:hypothetical protein
MKSQIYKLVSSKKFNWVKKKTLYKALYGFGNSLDAIGLQLLLQLVKFFGMIIGMPISAYRINNWQS